MAKISLETLQDLVLEEGISETELQVLSLALDGKSPSEIKMILNSSSENAVQKKLARIYAKFRISGAGPGKLPKLQKILIDRLQARQGKKRVLLCFAGSYESQQREGIHSIFRHPQVETLLLDTEITANSPWLDQATQSLKGADFCILCLTREFLEGAYGSFAVGFLIGQSQNLQLLSFSQALLLHAPSHLRLIDGTHPEELAQLLGKMIGDHQDAADWVNFKLSTSHWLETLDRSPPPPDHENDLSYQLVVDAGMRLIETNSCVEQNRIFKKLITEVLINIGKQIEAVGSNGQVFAIPIELYPRYLVTLQRYFQLKVKAIAVMQSVETFWGADEGDEIGETANSASERLFVFPDEASFNKSTSFLLKHALHYKVYVTTWETYEPLAAEYSIRGQLTQWKDPDPSLPTREYAVIKTPEGDRLLAWYDQDTSKNNRSNRFINFSAIQEQATLYEDAFDRLVKAQGVFQFQPDSSTSQDTVIEKLDQLKDGLFRQMLPATLRVTPERLLETLQTFRNELIHKEQLSHISSDDRKTAVIQTALRRVRELLHAQVASIFLFAKDGRLHRVGMNGIDDLSQQLDHQTFYPGESYAVGEGFTGRAAVPTEDGYGKPQWTNRLHEEDLVEGTEYSKRMKLHCAIAVPLNGQNKTYGVLEVINKVDPRTGSPINFCSFAPNEIPLLSAMGSFVANAISNIRRDKQNKLYADLSDLLVRSPSQPSELQDIYNKIAGRLITNETAFEVCILRVKTHNALVVGARKAVDRVTWKTRQDAVIKAGDGLVGQSFQLRQPVLVENIRTRTDQFKSKEWIELNGFESFGCFPLIYQEEVVGTLSLYTGYQYEFHPGVKEFLGRVASLIAAFIGKIIESAVVRDVVTQLDESEQSSDPLVVAKARTDLNDTFIRSDDSGFTPADVVSSPNMANLIYFD